MPPPPQRGSSTTVWFALVVVALLMVAGLVIDGGAQTAAARRAETTAQAAARVGADAAATGSLGGRPEPVLAVQAARQHLASAQVAGTVRLAAGDVVVETTVEVPTTFLSLVGVERLTAAGSARARLRRA